MATSFTNTSATRRVWTRLINADTGTTLELDPGESANVGIAVMGSDGAVAVVDLPPDFAVDHLERTTPRRPVVAEVPSPAEVAEQTEQSE